MAKWNHAFLAQLADCMLADTRLDILRTAEYYKMLTLRLR